jgi:NitT/TauT family transport system permease protein
VSKVANAMMRYVPLLLLAMLWEACTRFGIISELVLPPLSGVIASWITLFESGNLLYHTGASLLRGAAGLISAIVLGTALGILMARVVPIRIVFRPLVQMFYPIPKSALIPLMMIWLGVGDTSKIVLIFLGCMLPVTVSAYNGARGVDQVLIWSARSLGATRGEVLREVIAPAALPEILAGIRTALALSFLLLVSSELLISREGLGYLISNFGDGGLYNRMFAVVLTVSALGFAADRGYLAFTRWMLAWRE